MKKVLVVVAVLGSLGVALRRVRAGRAEQALWAEATDEV